MTPAIVPAIDSVMTPAQSQTLALLPNLGPLEIGVILVIGLLLFGRRLPEVGRNVGRSIIEFKRGLRDVSTELEEESRRDKDRQAKSPPSLSETSGGPTESTAQPASQSEAASMPSDSRTVSQSGPGKAESEPTA